jgi:hypothetical protein
VRPPEAVGRRSVLQQRAARRRDVRCVCASALGMLWTERFISWRRHLTREKATADGLTCALCSVYGLHARGEVSVGVALVVGRRRAWQSDSVGLTAREERVGVGVQNAWSRCSRVTSQSRRNALADPQASIVGSHVAS